MTQAERDEIVRLANIRGLHWELVMAVRIAENGRDDEYKGAPYGVLPPIPNWHTALRVCTASLRNMISTAVDRVPLFELAEGEVFSPVTGERYRRLAYTEALIDYIRDRYAPLRAANDPNNKNRNWARNVTLWYNKLMRDPEAWR